jgi:hypothetical protein
MGRKYVCEICSSPIEEGYTGAMFEGTVSFPPQNGRVQPSTEGRSEVVTVEERVLESVATFWVGQVMHLRPDMGGGAWKVVELLPKTDWWQRARALRYDCRCRKCLPQIRDSKREE